MGSLTGSRGTRAEPTRLYVSDSTLALGRDYIWLVSERTSSVALVIWTVTGSWHWRAAIRTRQRWCI